MADGVCHVPIAKSLMELDAWIEANKADFDAQGVFDAVFQYAAEAEAAGLNK